MDFFSQLDEANRMRAHLDQEVNKAVGVGCACNIYFLTLALTLTLTLT